MEASVSEGFRRPPTLSGKLRVLAQLQDSSDLARIGKKGYTMQRWVREHREKVADYLEEHSCDMLADLLGLDQQLFRLACEKTGLALA